MKNGLGYIYDPVYFGIDRFLWYKQVRPICAIFHLSNILWVFVGIDLTRVEQEIYQIWKTSCRKRGCCMFTSFLADWTIESEILDVQQVARSSMEFDGVEFCCPWNCLAKLVWLFLMRWCDLIWFELVVYSSGLICFLHFVLFFLWCPFLFYLKKRSMTPLKNYASTLAQHSNTHCTTTGLELTLSEVTLKRGEVHQY